MATMAQFVPTEVPLDLDVPQREAAFFYGRHREAEREPELRDIFSRIVEYRRHVLAIFDSLVGWDGQQQRVQ